MLNNFLLFLFPAGAPVTLAKQIIDTTPLVADKQLKSCQYNQKQQWIY